jgi:hypothetical protein
VYRSQRILPNARRRAPWCWFAALLTGDVAAAHDLPGNARIVEYDSPAAGLRLKYTNVRFWPKAVTRDSQAHTDQRLAY